MVLFLEWQRRRKKEHQEQGSALNKISNTCWKKG